MDMCDIKILGDHNSLIVHKGYKYRDDNLIEMDIMFLRSKNQLLNIKSTCRKAIDCNQKQYILENVVTLLKFR